VGCSSFVRAGLAGLPLLGKLKIGCSRDDITMSSCENLRAACPIIPTSELWGTADSAFLKTSPGDNSHSEQEKPFETIRWRSCGRAGRLGSWQLQGHQAGSQRKESTYNGQHFARVLVIGMSNDPAIRDDFEDPWPTRQAKASTPFPAITSCCGEGGEDDSDS